MRELLKVPAPRHFLSVGGNENRASPVPKPKSLVCFNPAFVGALDIE